MTAVQCVPVAQPDARAERPDARGAVRIADARLRQRVTLAGTIRATETVTAASSPLYRCVLADGTGEADLLFLGRSRVGGLTAGTCCRAEGRATVRGGRLAVWNPRYQAGPPPVPGRVLVVEDQKSMRRVLELIVLDLGLPDMDGLQVIAGVRAFSAVPILVISARDAETAAARAGAAGADDYLTKPFEIGQLVGRVRAALPSAADRTRGQRARAPN
jgi:hypothetical protein